MRRDSNGTETATLSCFVDNLVVAAATQAAVDAIKTQLAARFKTSNGGRLNLLLGRRFEQHNGV